MQITRNCSETAPGPSDWFTGVHFTPGARTAWQTHPSGQTIWVTKGVGLCQRRGVTHLAMLDVDEEGNPATWGDHVTGRGVPDAAALAPVNLQRFTSALDDAAPPVRSTA